MAARWQRLRAYWPDLLAFGGALVTAALAAVLVGSLHGCGGGGAGGVGSEGTGSFAMGPISGFGSIIVNGVRYDDSAATVLDDDGQPVARARLALGTVVQIDGAALVTGPDGVPTAPASRVQVLRSVVGPIDAINLGSGLLQVLGQTVQVTATTVVDEALSNGLSSLSVGQVVEVHGSYDASRSTYLASRIALATDSSYRVRGPVATLDDSAKTFSIGSQTYSYSALAGATSITEGNEVQVRVAADRDGDDHWVVEDEKSSDKVTDRDGSAVEIEGVVASVLSSTRFVIDGTTVDASAARIEGQIAVGAVVEVEGRVSNGVLVAEKVEASSSGVVRDFELKGTVGQLDVAAQRFVLRGTTVDYGRPDLRFKDGGLSQLADGVAVKVKGVLSSDRTRVEATEISFDD